MSISFLGALLVGAVTSPHHAPAVGLQEVEGFRLSYERLVLFDGDGDLATKGDQVTLTGQLGLDVDAEGCSILDGGPCSHLVEVEASAVGLASLMVEASTDASFGEFLIEDPGLPPTPLFTVPTLFGDLTVAMRFLGALKVGGSIEAGARFGAAMEVPFSAGFDFDPGFAFDVDLPDPYGLLTSAPVAAGNIASNVSLGGLAAVEFTTTLNAVPVPSPSFFFGPESTLSVQPLSDPWWSVDARVNLYGAIGLLPAEILVGPVLLESIVLPGLDAGGAIDDPGQVPAVHYAQSIDLGAGAKSAFVIPKSDDPNSSLVGTQGTLSILALVELDAAGAVTEAWSFSGATPRDAVPSPAGAMLAGSVGSDMWFAEWLGGGPSASRGA